MMIVKVNDLVDKIGGFSMAVNRICEECLEFNKTCRGMATYFSGCIYFKKKEESDDEKEGEIKR